MTNNAGDLIDDFFSWTELEADELLTIPVRRQMITYQQILLNTGSDLEILGEVVVL